MMSTGEREQGSWECEWLVAMPWQQEAVPWMGCSVPALDDAVWEKSLHAVSTTRDSWKTAPKHFVSLCPTCPFPPPKARSFPFWIACLHLKFKQPLLSVFNYNLMEMVLAFQLALSFHITNVHPSYCVIIISCYNGFIMQVPAGLN